MLRGWNRTPPNVKNPITVCNTDFPTPTKEAVIAEHTEAHKNCENVKMHPEITNVMKTGMKPSSEIFLKIFLINLWNQIFQKCKRNPHFHFLRKTTNAVNSDLQIVDVFK